MTKHPAQKSRNVVSVKFTLRMARCLFQTSSSLVGPQKFSISVKMLFLYHLSNWVLK